jgi:uncharacterized peroxidase-related enzyme
MRSTREECTDTTMPHIAVSSELPGIRGLLAFKPALGQKFLEFTEQLMRGPSALAQGERELIATYVSFGNECHFCTSSHAAATLHSLPNGGALVTAVCADVHTAPLSDLMYSLLIIADKVRVGGKEVTSEDVAAARRAGATDEHVHDTVLIAAAFCLANRYVDGLNAITPTDHDQYDATGKRLAAGGYLDL